MDSTVAPTHQILPLPPFSFPFFPFPLKKALHTLGGLVGGIDTGEMGGPLHIPRSLPLIPLGPGSRKGKISVPKLILRLTLLLALAPSTLVVLVHLAFQARKKTSKKSVPWYRASQGLL